MAMRNVYSLYPILYCHEEEEQNSLPHSMDETFPLVVVAVVEVVVVALFAVVAVVVVVSISNLLSIV